MRALSFLYGGAAYEKDKKGLIYDTDDEEGAYGGGKESCLGMLLFPAR